MRSFSLVTSFWIIVGLAIQVHLALGSGPDSLPPLLVYNYSMSDCSRFRNETILRPQFIVWPEDNGLIHFRYCCEYQPNGTSSTFELSKFSYFPNSVALQVAPYFDVGIVDKRNTENLWWPHWLLWHLENKRPRSMLYCEVSDMRRFYLSRFWREVMRKGTFTWLILLLTVPLPVYALTWLGRRRQIGLYKDKENIDWDTEARHERVRFNRDLIDTSWKALCRALLDLLLAVSASLIVLVIFLHFIAKYFKRQCVTSCFEPGGCVHNFFEPERLKPKRAVTAENGGGDGGGSEENHSQVVVLTPEHRLMIEHIREVMKPQEEAFAEQKLMMKHMREVMKPQVCPFLNLEEGFADASHILLVALVASGFMEATAHSDLLSWRGDVMFNAAVAYAYLTLFAVTSVWIRHCLYLELQHQADWRWQKVFAQLVALMMMGTYLELVEDVTEVRLDSFASLVMGACVAASVWSAGVEMVVIARYLWQKLGKHVIWMLFACISIMPTVLIDKNHRSERQLPTTPPASGNCLAAGSGRRSNRSSIHDVGLVSGSCLSDKAAPAIGSGRRSNKSSSARLHDIESLSGK